MKIELNQNKIFYNNGKSIQEIHPFWLRERVDGEEFLDKGTQQRLFDPSVMSGEIIVKKVEINVPKIFDVVNSMNSKTSFGGTATKNIKKMITKYRSELK